LAVSAAFRSSLGILEIHHSLVLLWTGTSFLGNNNTLFKILFLSFSEPSIVNLKLNYNKGKALQKYLQQQ